MQLYLLRQGILILHAKDMSAYLNNTTFRYSSLVYGLCVNLYFLIHRILKFQDSRLRMRISTKPNGKQKWSKTAEKWHFCWLVTSLPMYLKSRGLRTDHKRVKKSWNVVLFCYADKRKMRFGIYQNMSFCDH